MNICYKVTNLLNQSFVPYISIDYKIQYRIGEFVKPKIGKIFVFEKFEYAAEFLENEGGEGIIWEAEFKNSSSSFSTYYEKILSYPAYLRNLELFWDKEKRYDYELPLKAPPRGTLFVEELKLIKVL